MAGTTPTSANAAERLFGPEDGIDVAGEHRHLRQHIEDSQAIAVVSSSQQILQSVDVNVEHREVAGVPGQTGKQSMHVGAYVRSASGASDSVR